MADTRKSSIPMPTEFMVWSHKERQDRLAEWERRVDALLNGK